MCLSLRDELPAEELRADSLRAGTTPVRPPIVNAMRKRVGIEPPTDQSPPMSSPLPSGSSPRQSRRLAVSRVCHYTVFATNGEVSLIPKHVRIMAKVLEILEELRTVLAGRSNCIDSLFASLALRDPQRSMGRPGCIRGLFGSCCGHRPLPPA